MNVSFKVFKYLGNDVRCCGGASSTLLLRGPLTPSAKFRGTVSGLNNVHGRNVRVSLRSAGVGAGSFA